MHLDEVEYKKLRKLKEGDKVIVLHKYVYDYSYNISIEVINKKTQNYITLGKTNYKVSRDNFCSSNGPYIKYVYFLNENNLKILNEKIIKEEVLRLKFRIKQYVDEADFGSIKEIYDFMVEKKVLKKVDVKLDFITLK